LNEWQERKLISESPVATLSQPHFWVLGQHWTRPHNNWHGLTRKMGKAVSAVPIFATWPVK
jgi:hypothetical protein